MTNELRPNNKHATQTEDQLREAARQALDDYLAYLNLRRQYAATKEERDDALYSHAQVHSAQRVLWFES